MAKKTEEEGGVLAEVVTTYFCCLPIATVGIAMHKKLQPVFEMYTTALAASLWLVTLHVRATSLIHAPMTPIPWGTDKYMWLARQG